MPFAQWLIYRFDPILLGLSVVFIWLFLAVGGLLISRRFLSHKDLKEHNDFAGFVFGTIGAIYSVILAFTVVIVWGYFDKASSNVEMEASYLADVYRDTQALPKTFTVKMDKLLADYGKAIVEDEWETMQEDKKSDKVQRIQNEIWEIFQNYEPVTEKEKIFFEEVVGKLNELCEYRRLRLMEAGKGVNSILWFVLIFCGMITIFFTFFFGIDNARNQMIMTALLAMTIGLVLFTILEFDYPFTGKLRVSPEPFKTLRLLDGAEWDSIK